MTIVEWQVHASNESIMGYCMIDIVFMCGSSQWAIRDFL